MSYKYLHTHYIVNVLELCHSCLHCSTLTTSEGLGELDIWTTQRLHIMYIKMAVKGTGHDMHSQTLHSVDFNFSEVI